METKNVKILDSKEIVFTKKQVIIGTMKVFLLALAISTIVPLILTIVYLDQYWSQLKAGLYYVDVYGDVPAFYEFGMLLSNILSIIIPFTIAATIGQRLVYTKMKRKALIVLIVPVIAIVLFIIMSIIGETIIAWTESW